MTRPLPVLLLVLAAVALISATPDPEAEDLVRRGNQAFAHGHYNEAAALYRQAEERTTDPGLVAFNNAAALYKQGEYAEAENYYWLSLGDAGPDVEARLKRYPNRDLPPALRKRAGDRLAPVLYNLGNCLLKRSDGSNPDVLEQAIVAFDHCARLNWGERRFQADVRHNWELAKEFLRLHPRPPRQDKSNSEKEGSQPPQPKETPGTEPGDQGNEKKQNPGTRPDPDEKVGSGDKAQETEETTPGKGNLAPLPDSDKLRAMTPGEAAAYLRQAVDRILGERRAYQEQAAKFSSHHVRDW
jgi:tetratricopeptide (TPR) repeat protein